VPLFGIFLGAIILAIGAFVLWLEMIIRDAAIYIGLFFVPLTFVAMIWPATSRYARRLVEFLVAVILAKFVIVAIIGLASAAITNAGAGGGDQPFERMMGGAALLVLAAWSPFALLRLIPMMEMAASGVVSQRSAMSSASQSAGIQSPAGYMRQAMDRHSRATASPAYEGTTGTTYGRSEASPQESTSEQVRSRQDTIGSGRHDEPSSGPGGATRAPVETPSERRPQGPPPAERRPEPPPPPPPAHKPPPGEND
jgi:hypothetical protein